MDIPSRLSSSLSGPADTCRRCGSCCREGGPTLHLADRESVEKGLLPAHDLVTLRVGERVYDNFTGCLILSQREMIKIRGKGADWSCMYFDSGTRSCGIYDQRPVQCRVQKCWDPAEAAALSREPGLTRVDLLGEVAGLWDLISEHERRCAYSAVSEMADHLYRNPSSTACTQRIQEMTAYDAALRQTLRERLGAKADTLDFLLGRPLVDTLPGFGFTLHPGPRDRTRIGFSIRRYQSLIQKS
ncbi:MAG: YkgJ family cysteine cluster protein [Desulfobacterales bacterium]